MKISKIWLWSSALAGVLMAWVSYLGISVSDTYAKETLNWASQAIGQDYVNLFLAAPALIISAYFINKGSLKAYLVWLGVLIYVIYSYILYAFFVHFGPHFLIYVAVLGLSFYSLVGSLSEVDRDSLPNVFSRVKVTYAQTLLLVVALMFSLLWLSDIMGALSKNSLPAGVSDIGLWVNPIQVLDLAFLLPGAIITALLLGKRKSIGYLFAVPLMVFFMIMGTAIIVIFWILSKNGYLFPMAQGILMSAIIIANLLVSYDFLNKIDRIRIEI